VVGENSTMASYIEEKLTKSETVLLKGRIALRK